MAFRHTNAVWQMAGLTPSQKLVLLRLADRANRETSVAWSSQQTLASECGLKQRSVRVMLHELCRKGYLVVLEPPKQHRATRYRVCVTAESREELDSPLKTLREELSSPLKTTAHKMQRGSRKQPERNYEAAREELSSSDPERTILNHPYKPAAPVCAFGEHETLGKEKSGIDESPSPDDQTPPTSERVDEPNVPPFEVYVAIAGQAIKDVAISTKRADPDIAEVEERFKQLCAKQGLPYDSDITRRAVEAAVVARAKAKQKFLATAHRFAPVSA